MEMVSGSQSVLYRPVLSVRGDRWFLMGALTVLTALGAFVRIPLPGTPVPFTLQTLIVLVAGGLLGSRFGAGSQALYVGLGCAGIPWFAGAAFGLAHFAGPTGGYLLGFPLAAAFVGKFIGSAQEGSRVRMISVLAGGLGIIFLCGLLHLRLSLGIPLSQAVTLGVLPFIPGGILKVGAAAAILRSLSGRVRAFDS